MSDGLDAVIASLQSDALTPAPVLRDVDTTPPSYVLVVCIDEEHRQRVIRDLRADGYEVQA